MGGYIIDKNGIKLVVLLYVLNKLLDYVNEEAYDSVLKIIDVVKKELRKEKNFVNDFNVNDLDKNKIYKKSVASLKDLQKKYPKYEDIISWLLILFKTKAINIVFEEEGVLKR